MEYDGKLCEKQHEILTKVVDNHELRLNEHENKINGLTTNNAQQDTKIDNLCDKIEKLIINQNKWFYAVCIGMGSILVKIVFFK